MGLRTRVLACSVVLTAVVLTVVPGGRSFAAGVAQKISHLRSPTTPGPIPFILDLRKHGSRKQHAAPAPRKVSPKRATPAAPGPPASSPAPKQLQ